MSSKRVISSKEVQLRKWLRVNEALWSGWPTQAYLDPQQVIELGQKLVRARCPLIEAIVYVAGDMVQELRREHRRGYRGVIERVAP